MDPRVQHYLGQKTKAQTCVALRRGGEAARRSAETSVCGAAALGGRRNNQLAANGRRRLHGAYLSKSCATCFKMLHRCTNCDASRHSPRSSARASPASSHPRHSQSRHRSTPQEALEAKKTAKTCPTLPTPAGRGVQRPRRPNSGTSICSPAENRAKGSDIAGWNHFLFPDLCWRAFDWPLCCSSSPSWPSSTSQPSCRTVAPPQAALFSKRNSKFSKRMPARARRSGHSTRSWGPNPSGTCQQRKSHCQWRRWPCQCHRGSARPVAIANLARRACGVLPAPSLPL